MLTNSLKIFSAFPIEDQEVLQLAFWLNLQFDEILIYFCTDSGW